MTFPNHRPDPLQGHTREWPSTPYSDEARAEAPPVEQSCCVVLFGDCTVYCRYYPPANRPEHHLAVRLRRAFPGQPFGVRNVAVDGETAGNFVASGRMDRVLADLPGIDVAFVRYGVNDRKRDGISGCVENLRALCGTLRDRYAGVMVVVETGLWVDYPNHYLWDRNSRLAPLYDAMKAFAEAEGYPVLDIFERTRMEIEGGNWDLHVRGLPDPDHVIVDDAFDPFFGDDPAFFSNIHPNSRCLGLVADWQVALLKTLFGDRLPNGDKSEKTKPTRPSPVH